MTIFYKKKKKLKKCLTSHFIGYKMDTGKKSLYDLKKKELKT